MRALFYYKHVCEVINRNNGERGREGGREGGRIRERERAVWTGDKYLNPKEAILVASLM